jgi:hypothetical protein
MGFYGAVNGLWESKASSVFELGGDAVLLVQMKGVLLQIEDGEGRGIY